MAKTYYIQSFKKFYKELANLNNILAEINEDGQCVVYAAVMPLLEALGFTKKEDGTLKAPKVHSIWGLRAYSKRLIVLQDIEKYIEDYDLDLDLDDFTDEEIGSVLDIIASQTEYPEHVHQPEYIIQGAITLLKEYLDEDEEDDNEGEDDDDGEEETEEKTEEKTKKDHHWSDVANVLEQVSKHLKDVGDALNDAIAE
jgi:hypothetical protein